MAKTSKPAAPAQADTTLYGYKKPAALTKHATAIRQLGKRVAADIIEIGRRLVECRDRHLEHGQWLPWLRTEFDWSERTALNFIRVYEQSKSENFSDLNLPVSSLYLLAAPNTSKAARKEIAKRAKGGEVIKHKDVKRIIKKHKAAKKLGAEVDSADPEISADKPNKANALTWERLCHGTQAITSAGTYSPNKLGEDEYVTIFWSRKGGGSFSIGRSTSLKEAKALAQAHHERGEPAPAPAPAPAAAPGSFERWQAEAAAAAQATAPGAKPTRSEILNADGWWAVCLADNDIENARKIYDLLCDDERRTVFVETLGKAIDLVVKDDKEALVEVMADALGVNGNDTGPAASADRMRKEFAAKDDEPSGWRIQFREYPKGWFWSASGNDKVLSSNPTALFATREEAQADAHAAIARDEKVVAK